MKKIVVLGVFLALTLQSARSELAPVPTCNCNDISSQFKLDKKAELQIKNEAEKMDNEANLLNEQKDNNPKQTNKKTKFNLFNHVK